MGIIKQIIQKNEDLNNKIIILESKLSELNRKIDILRAEEKVPPGVTYTPVNPYSGEETAFLLFAQGNVVINPIYHQPTQTWYAIGYVSVNYNDLVNKIYYVFINDHYVSSYWDVSFGGWDHLQIGVYSTTDGHLLYYDYGGTSGAVLSFNYKIYTQNII